MAPPSPVRPNGAARPIDPARLDLLDAQGALPTPVVALGDEASGTTVLAKVEAFQPSGSTKDRIARSILLAAAAEGRLTTATTVVEASSGSTSISLAMACATLGIRFRAVMPEGVSSERLLIIQRFGGESELTPLAGGVPASIERTHELAAADPHVLLSDQFNNPRNAEAHEQGTGAELVAQLEGVGGRLDGFVAAVGTGGTLMGAGAAVRARFPAATLARVRVADGPADAEQGGVPCGIAGVVDCLSGLLDPGALGLAGEIEVTRVEALATTRELARRGLPVGPSSGLNVAGARKLAIELGRGAVVATVLCDRMERYFSTDLFDDVRTEGC
jgi:cysteine synthase A